MNGDISCTTKIKLRTRDGILRKSDWEKIVNFDIKMR